MNDFNGAGFEGLLYPGKIVVQRRSNKHVGRY